MTETEIQDLEQIIDEQQERIEALEEALHECSQVLGWMQEDCPNLRVSTQTKLLRAAMRLHHLERQQAGGNDD